MILSFLVFSFKYLTYLSIQTDQAPVPLLLSIDQCSYVWIIFQQSSGPSRRGCCTNHAYIVGAQILWFKGAADSGNAEARESR